MWWRRLMGWVCICARHLCPSLRIITRWRKKSKCTRRRCQKCRRTSLFVSLASRKWKRKKIRMMTKFQQSTNSSHRFSTRSLHFWKQMRGARLILRLKRSRIKFRSNRRRLLQTLALLKRTMSFISRVNRLICFNYTMAIRDSVHSAKACISSGNRKSSRRPISNWSFNRINASMSFKQPCRPSKPKLSLQPRSRWSFWKPLTRKSRPNRFKCKIIRKVRRRR